jgi:hypothetical protein
LRGVFGKSRFGCGVFVVTLWWDVSFSWSRDGRLCGAEKHATDFDFIFASNVEKKRMRDRFGKGGPKYSSCLDSLI